MPSPRISMAILFAFVRLGFFVYGHYGPEEETAFRGGREHLFMTAGEGAEFGV
jgi:hypothetical protein